MSRLDRIEHRFVDFVPESLEPGVLYISLEFRAVMHSCCCGCGATVSTPLSPAQWNLTYDGETISLAPSVGNGVLPCNSHYWIRENTVHWAPPLAKHQTVASLQRDRAVAIDHLRPQPSPEVSTTRKRGFLRRLMGREKR
jgi:hypothetical protein